MNRIISTTAIALTFILAQPVTANAAEIKVWAARAIATVLAEIPKGRVQDRDYNQLPIVETLITRGKESIPYLISKLEDETKIEGHVLDYWSDVRVGDVALIILTDFFTDRTWQRTTIAGISWDEFLERGGKSDLTGEQLLRHYIARHGRNSIRNRWLEIWTKHSDKMFWDEGDRCFKVRNL